MDNKNNLKQYLTIALVIFGTFCCCTLFFFLIYRYHGFADSWRGMFSILQPITMGLVLAYLLNPVMCFFERYLQPFLEKYMKDADKAKTAARYIATTGALVFFLGIITLLIVAVVPSLRTSIEDFIVALPGDFNDLIDWVYEFVKGDTQLATALRDVLENASETLQSFLNEGMLTQVQSYLVSITSGVVSGVKFVINILVGLVISVYVMVSKEKFAGQAKKILYAVFKPVRANIIIKTVHKCNEIFGGFISGKILDSAIIGVLAYIILSIMQMPDALLVSVIVGVTNVIPFFGPFIGAIPSFVIIVLQSPIQGLYFLIFILILQQVDGNIIGPKILGDSTGLSAFWVVFAILVFGGMWGFVGMLLGVPIMAVIYYIVKNVVEFALKKRGLPMETEHYEKMTRVDKETNKLVYEFVPKTKIRKKKKRK